MGVLDDTSVLSGAIKLLMNLSPVAQGFLALFCFPAEHHHEFSKRRQLELPAKLDR